MDELNSDAHPATMYYNPPQSSPGLSHKLANHHDSPWNRSHHPVLGAPGPNAISSPQASPAYALYTNGSTMQHHPGPHMPPHPSLQHHHHHQNSVSHPAYPSPPSGHIHPPHALTQGSPGNEVMTQHWQQQLLKYDVRSQILCFEI